MTRIRRTRLALILALGVMPLAGTACEKTMADTTGIDDAPMAQASRAEGPGGHGLFRGLFRGIDVSDEQRARLQAVRDTFRSELEAVRTDLKPLREQLADARRSGDRERVRQLVAEARAARDAVKPLRERMLAAMRAVLTPAQQAQFDENIRRIGEHRRHGARHGGRNSMAHLELTEAQRTEVRQIVERHRPELEALHAQVRPLHERFAQARRSGDQAALKQLRSELKPLRERAAAIHRAIHDEVRELLTPEQRERFDAHAERTRGRHQGFGRLHGRWSGK